MGLLRAKPKAAVPAGHVGRDPLDAAPIVPERVEAHTDGKGLVQLRMTVDRKPTVWEQLAAKGKPTSSGGGGRAIFLSLDARGSRFWSLIDGRRDLRSIAATLATEWRVTEQQAREAAITFTRDLMLRGFVQVRVETGQTEEAAKTQRREADKRLD